MKFAHVRVANISHLQGKYLTAKRFHLPEWANFVGHLLYRRCPESSLYFLGEAPVCILKNFEKV